MIKVSPDNLIKIIDMTPCDQAILIAGAHGIGKSTIVEAYSKSKGRKLIEIFLGQLNDAGDLVGPTVRIGDKKFGFLDPQWWPEEGEVCDIFFDELNRARQELHSPIFQLVLRGEMMGRTLPGWGTENGPRIFAAINAGDDYFVQEMDPALLSRFNMYTLVVTHKDWISWASRSEINTYVIQFIEKNPNSLWTKAEGTEKGADPRTWHRASDFMRKNMPIDPHGDDSLVIGYALEGIVGSAASQFMQFLKSGGLSATDMLKIKEGANYESDWNDIYSQLQLTRETDLCIINTQFIASAKVKLAPLAITRYGVAFAKYIKWLVENEKREQAASALSELKEDPKAMSVYLLNNDIVLYMTAILDSLASD